jgi:hypothetical protein
MPEGEPGEVLTPGTNEERDVAGAGDIRTGTSVHRVWWRKTQGLFLDLLRALAHAYPAAWFTPLSVVVDNYQIHKARAGERWLAAPPRFVVLFLPTSCPQASPIARACGEVHDKCTRNHRPKQLGTLVTDVEQHLALHGPWHSEFSALYYPPEVTAALQELRRAETAPQEISQLAA